MKTLTSAITLSVLLSVGVAATFAQSGKPGSDISSGKQQTTSDNESRSRSKIRGKVITEGGRPVPDATIMIFPVNVAGNMTSAVASFLRPVTSNADGSFELTSLQPGAYTVSASSPGYVLSEQDPKSFYRPGDVATLNLIKGGVITGKVTNSSGEPVVGAVIRAIKTRESDESPSRVRS